MTFPRQPAGRRAGQALQAKPAAAPTLPVRVFGSMKCCKPMRQWAGMECGAGHMTLCLAEVCAKKTSPAERKQFASEVATVQIINRADMLEAFRTRVEQLVKARASTQAAAAKEAA